MKVNKDQAKKILEILNPKKKPSDSDIKSLIKNFSLESFHKEYRKLVKPKLSHNRLGWTTKLEFRLVFGILAMSALTNNEGKPWSRNSIIEHAIRHAIKDNIFNLNKAALEELNYHIDLLGVNEFIDDAVHSPEDKKALIKILNKRLQKV